MINKKVSISMSRVHNLFIKSSVVVLATAVFIIGGFSVYRAHAQNAVLGVTQITATQTFASADNTYANGWKWVFDVTVPSNQTLLRMKFADWVNGSNIIPAGGNMQFYSVQSLNAMDEAHAIPITASSTLSDIMYLNPDIDQDVLLGGRQIQITIETKVPVGSASGSFSTSYGINTTATSSISFSNLLQTYNSNPLPVTITTDPTNLSTNVIYTGFGTTTYNATTTPPTHVGTYNVYAQVTDPNYTGTSSAILVINQAPISVVANPQTKVYDGATSTDPALTYTSTPAPFGSDTFTGSLTRDPGEDVGSYNINQGSLALSGDYVLTYSPGSFVITPASASISFSSTTQTYDKTGKSVGVTTTPLSLTYSVTYDGVASLPVNAGTYTTLATITDPNYEGSNSVDLVINKAPLTVTATTSTKVYDASTSSSDLPQITSGQLFSTDTAVWSQSFDTKDVGHDKTLTATGVISDGNNSGGNYDVTFIKDTTGSITPATATVTAQGHNKVYDGTTDASTTELTVGGGVGGDILTATGNSIFSDSNVGTNKLITVTNINVTGQGVTADDYIYDTSTTTSADISAKELTVTANDASKVYGDTLTFVGNEFTSAGLVTGDTITSVTLNSTGALDTATVTGSPYDITPSDALGTGLGNYSISYANGKLNVTTKSITTNIVADNKTYDGNDVASTSCTLNGIVNSNDVSCITTGSVFSDKNVHANKIVTTNVSLGGNDKDNYFVVTPATTTATITTRPITVSAVTDSKTYDGTASSTGLPTVTSGTIASVDTAPIWTQTFNDKNVSNNKIITPAGIVNDGNSGNNYSVTYATTTGEITTKDLLVTATGVDKTYDASTTATVSLSDDRVSGDTLSTSYTHAEFADANVDNGKTVTVYGIDVTGTDSSNYHLVDISTTTTANITQASLTITADDISKVYGDTVTLGATSTGFVASGLQTGDHVTDVTLTSSGDVITANIAGSPYVLTPSNATGTPGLAVNYNISYANGKLTVTPKHITASIVADGKTYDGTNVASTSCELENGIIINNDVVSCSTTNATFSSRNAGTWTVTASTTLSESGASNYIANSTASVSAIISPLHITVTASPSTRVYDGSTNSSSTPSVSPAIGTGDVANFIETYDNRNVGTSTPKVMTPSGSILFGSDDVSGNYIITPVSSSNGIITPEPLTITAVGNTKTYDGTNVASALPSITSGTIFSPDSVHFSEVYGDVNAGPNKLMTASGNVNDDNNGNNYSYNFVTSNDGVINQVKPYLSSIGYSGSGNYASTTSTTTFGYALTGPTATGINKINLQGQINYNVSGGTIIESDPNSYVVVIGTLGNEISITATFTPDDSNYTTASQTTQIKVSNPQ